MLLPMLQALERIEQKLDSLLKEDADRLKLLTRVLNRDARDLERAVRNYPVPKSTEE